VNPGHLFIGTPAKNQQDMYAKRRHPNARLTNEQVRAIRDDPRPQKEIMAEYGLQSRDTVYRIKTRRLWAHLP
jgi:hypothetical protein